MICLACNKESRINNIENGCEHCGYAGFAIHGHPRDYINNKMVERVNNGYTFEVKSELNLMTGEFEILETRLAEDNSKSYEDNSKSYIDTDYENDNKWFKWTMCVMLIMSLIGVIICGVASILHHYGYLPLK